MAHAGWVLVDRRLVAATIVALVLALGILGAASGTGRLVALPFLGIVALLGARLVVRLTSLQRDLRRSEQRYRSLLDATTSIVGVTDAGGRFVEPTPAWEAFTGQTWDEYRGHGWLSALHPEERPVIADQVRGARARAERVEARLRLWHAPSDDYRYVMIRAAPVVDDRGVHEWVGTVTDVHDRTVAQMRAAGAARLRAAVLTSLHDALLVTDGQGTVIEVNDAWERLTGFTRAETLGARPPYAWWPDAETHPDERAAFDALRRQLRAGQDTGDQELWFRHRDGHLIPTLTSCAALVEDGELRLVVGSVKDNTERRAAAEALRAERDFREAIVGALHEGLYVLGRDGRVLDVNDAWTRITGFTRRDVRGAAPPHPWWPRDETTRQLLATHLDRSLRGEVAGELDTSIVTADGETRRVVINCHPVREPTSGEFVAVVGTFRDITRQARAELRLRTFAALTSRLALQKDVAGVASATLAELLPAFDTDIGLIALVDHDAATFGVVATAGMPADTSEKWACVPIDYPGPIRDVVLSRQLVEVRTGEELRRRYPAIADIAGARAMRSLVVVPLETAEVVVGALLVAFRAERHLSHDELEILEGTTPIVAQALDRARLFEFERSVASTLQHALLSTPPVGAADLAVAARYRPAVAELEVGGDWFDVVSLGDSRSVLVVGDVVGRGLPAAAVMGQLRSALGALALTTSSASEAIARLDDFASSIPGATAATICQVIVDAATGTIRYASAGHPPPLVVGPGGPRFLDDAQGWPLGIRSPDRLRPEATAHLAPGDTLLLYTDGLVERRGDPFEDGMSRLACEAAARAHLPVEELCDELLDVLVEPDHRDDVALVAVRLLAAGARDFTCRIHARPDELATMRRLLRRWLAHQDLPSDVEAEIVLAAGEACTNAVEHAYPDGSRSTVVVEAQYVPDREVLLTVRDYGSWRPIAPDPRRNRGLRLMSAVMDDVTIGSAPEGGTRVRMRRKLSPV